MNPSLHGRIDAIDGLRAIAVIGVILYHARPAFVPGGFVGVDVFFVISGYVVCRSLLAAPHEGFLRYVAAFYARRLVRIYPALLATLLTTLVLARLFIPDSYLSDSTNRTGYYALFGLSNVQLALATNGYFGAVTDFNPYVHTWSLGVEEQFYGLFPLLLLLAVRLGAAARPAVARCGFLLLPTLLAASLGFSAWETAASPDRAYFLLPGRFWELATGSVLCLAHARGRLLPRAASPASAFALLGLAAVGLGLACASGTAFPFPWALAPVLGTAACLAGVAVPAHRHLAARLLASGPVAYLGRISYSLYLWHWPAIVLVRWTVGLESPSTLAVALAATALLGVFSYHAIERPSQRLRPRGDRTPRVASRKPGRVGGRVILDLPADAVVVGLGLLAIGAAAYTYKRVERSTLLPLSVTMATGPAPNPWRPVSTLWSGVLFRADRPGPWDGHTLNVLGDSHAGALADAVEAVRKRTGASVYVFSEGGLNLGQLMSLQTDADRVAQRRVLADLRAHSRPGDVALLASLRVDRFCNQWNKLDIEDVIRHRDGEAAERTRLLAVREGCALIRELQGMGLIVAIQAPLPVLFSPPFRCSDWFNRSNPIGDRGFLMNREFLLAHRAAGMRSIREVQAEIPGVGVWDPFPLLCPDPVSSAFDGDRPLFFDGDHISGHGNTKLFPDLVRFLGSIWGDPSASRDGPVAPAAQ